MSLLFSNQDYGSVVLKHQELPIYITDNFNFYRCVSFDENFYRKTVSELHQGNLRENTPNNRYSKLFPNEKISYWADSPQTANAESKFHKSGNNLLTFWAYDDATSTFPTIDNEEPLVIIDGREIEFHNILVKFENNIELTCNEREIVEQIRKQNPDCLAYNSLRKKNGVNYLFFEKGFKKLSIREVRLYLGDMPGKNNNRIVCATSSDYSPHLKGYGKYFLPLAKIREDTEYIKSNEYITRNKIYNRSLERFRK